MPKRVLITGGTGFVGSHVVEKFLREGWIVRALVRNRKHARWISDLSIEFVEGSLADTGILYQAVKDCHLVIHCAGVTKAIRSDDYYKTNADSTKSLVVASRESEVKRFVYCSTHAAVGPTGSVTLIADESSICKPITDYGKSKLMGEEAVINNSGSMEWMILRPPSVIGPRDEQFVPLFKSVVNFGLSPVIGSQDQRYSFIFALDLVNSLYLAGCTTTGINEIYFVSNKESINWIDVSKQIGAIANKKLFVVKIPIFVMRIISFAESIKVMFTRRPILLSKDKIKEILSTGWVCSPKKIKDHLGFSCEYDLQYTLESTFDFYMKNKWI